ncbi:unnamed protein product [Moneuplotes crassus]|uniref:Uncharacterized protein n=1 Tax=Euplotes crassus TaxID=5936 RepID=A0AAD2D113_EUPCR|nr:unnamed protein product [Moneuplotes crassus]
MEGFPEGIRKRPRSSTFSMKRRKVAQTPRKSAFFSPSIKKSIMRLATPRRSSRLQKLSKASVSHTNNTVEESEENKAEIQRIPDLEIFSTFMFKVNESLVKNPNPLVGNIIQFGTVKAIKEFIWNCIHKSLEEKEQKSSSQGVLAFTSITDEVLNQLLTSFKDFKNTDLKDWFSEYKNEDFIPSLKSICSKANASFRGESPVEDLMLDKIDSKILLDFLNGLMKLIKIKFKACYNRITEAPNEEGKQRNISKLSSGDLKSKTMTLLKPCKKCKSSCRSSLSSSKVIKINKRRKKSGKHFESQKFEKGLKSLSQPNISQALHSTLEDSQKTKLKGSDIALKSSLKVRTSKKVTESVNSSTVQRFDSSQAFISRVEGMSNTINPQKGKIKREFINPKKGLDVFHSLKQKLVNQDLLLESMRETKRKSMKSSGGKKSKPRHPTTMNSKAFSRMIKTCERLIKISARKTGPFDKLKFQKDFRRLDSFKSFAMEKGAVDPDDSNFMETQNKKICEAYLQARFDDDIISYSRKFTNLSYLEIDEKASIIQRSWKCYKAKQLLKTMRKNFKENQRRLIQKMKDLVKIDPEKRLEINLDIMSDLNQYKKLDDMITKNTQS